jgi:hypothetical protein
MMPPLSFPVQVSAMVSPASRIRFSLSWALNMCATAWDSNHGNQASVQDDGSLARSEMPFREGVCSFEVTLIWSLEVCSTPSRFPDSALNSLIFISVSRKTYL